MPSESEKWGERNSAWAPDPTHVRVKLIGNAIDEIEPGVIVASFNAG
jgi:hypothetical protein